MLEYKMPSLGADMASGSLREWRVKPGDRIKKGDIIAEIETQKGIIEIEVFEDGVIGELLVKVDELVPVGTSMATILTEEEAAGKRPAPAEAPREEKPAEAPAPAGSTTETLPHHIRASPLARRIAEEKGIDIATIQGTGPEGAILREDVEHAIAAQAAPAAGKAAVEHAAVPEEVTPEKPAPPVAEEKPIPAAATAQSIRMAVAAAMSKSNREVPHYYLETKIDMSKALAWLADTNGQRPVKERLLPAVLLIKAVAKALNDVPALNAWWENGLQLKESIHIGYVVALRTGGIMVPAIHDTDTKSVEELMLALNDLIPRARALRLRSSELADSTITVTSLGEGGVETVYGVIYPPQVALVGFGGITEQPWSENGMLTVRPVLTATLAADHRASDGSTGSRFLTAIKNYLQQPEKL
ncbi:dihydrolipoamide acetyltransferase family protein [Pontibacter anaerobius]|uniref:Dihydrolipoamide acetyltransferase component of pyruvate dehydrogenase complex n=1 Tax=Pontibacter anaerobius TaxID=2993940 RepID=A0ABT3RAY5_9BACT|nr:dihydrolipoamide acetyltransferase family protein [Pontibacter anaerobius]MCX2739034.1 dihydrolipoamide acetyltransferase family protein [Pontibacter anaerobius]